MTTIPKETKSLTIALSYAQHGFQVFPLLPRSKLPYKGSRGVKDATKHRGQIRQWWGETPNANVGIATGKESGIFVIDVDTRHGGEKAFADLEAQHGPLPKTVTARTGGGGFHYLFRWPGWRVKNDNTGKVGPGIDVKGDGGYIVAPPSVHDQTGALYEWVCGLSPSEVDIVDAPLWLLERLEGTSKRRNADGATATPTTLTSGVQTVEDAIRLTLPESEGYRNSAIFNFARALKSMPDYASAAHTALKPVVRLWHDAALPKISTKDFDETWSDFVHAWTRVKHPMGTGPMSEAIANAKRAPLPSCAKQYDRADVRFLVKLCRELQRMAGDAPFYLTFRAAGDAIGKEGNNAGRFIKMLEADGVLSLVENGKRGRASRYRFIGKEKVETESTERPETTEMASILSVSS